MVKTVCGVDVDKEGFLFTVSNNPEKILKRIGLGHTVQLLINRL
ncbi:MAG: hypothetical protein ACW98F_03355 [Candidatus Hodarchaeales archaeon]|jgi:hypothetical protein